MNLQAKVSLREPSQVMRLKRLGSFHQCRLSFMRILLRRMVRDGWRVEQRAFEINDKGVGHAVYTAHGPERSYSLVAFAHDLPDEMRSDRVIAEAWDATFTLHDGIPSIEDIERLRANVPLQEAGRVSEREIVLARANRSSRLWAHVVDALADGRQPDTDKLDAVGYLMRTTAVYGSGKFGAADRAAIQDRAELDAPFQAEMLAVYLIRTFVRDLVEHAARAKGGEGAVKLDADIAQSIAIGNATGLGMAPFIVNHPVLFNNWINARETAIARVRAIEKASPDDIALFLNLFARSEVSVGLWRSDHPLQLEKLDALRRDLDVIRTHLDAGHLDAPRPWDRMILWAEESLGEDGQELLASLMLEPYGELIDDLTGEMSDHTPGTYRIDGSMGLGEVRDLLSRCFPWCTELDWSERGCNARAWYVSEEKLEPRLGERFEEPITDYEQPLAPGRDAARALDDLRTWDGEDTVAAFLLSHPEHRHIIRRAQLSRLAPYGEIHDNTICETMLPIDMLRAKLSYFGATHFDPRSDRWVRIRMFAGAPYPESLTFESAEFWVYPELPS